LRFSFILNLPGHNSDHPREFRRTRCIGEGSAIEEYAAIAANLAKRNLALRAWRMI